MSRGDLHQDIFLDEVDRHDFIKTLEWTRNELATGQKSHPIKLALAARLRRGRSLSIGLTISNENQWAFLRSDPIDDLWICYPWRFLS